jgi:hypothetical protein
MAIEVRKRGEFSKISELKRWWNEPSDRAGRALMAAAEAIEFATWRERYMSFVCARLMTGRSMPGSFACTMSDRSMRAAGSTWEAQFNPPALNVIAASADVFQNKVYNSRPFLRFDSKGGTYKSGLVAEHQTEFIDELWEELGMWPMMLMCGIDCMTFPSAFVKVCVNASGRIEHQRVMSDEILIAPTDMNHGNPRSLIQRVFVNREDALSLARGPRKDEIKAAILRAQSARSGYYKAQIQYDDVISLCEGWRLPLADGTPGRRVLAVDGITVDDKPWKMNRFPFAQLKYQPISGSWMGQSLAEIALPLQRKLDRVSLTIDELERRNAWPRWKYPAASGINPDMFKGPGFIPYNPPGPGPEPIQGPAAHKELYQQQFNMVQWIFQRLGINQGAQQGDTPRGLNSGLAILAFNQVDDKRHVSLSEAQEDFVTDIGRLDIAVAEEEDISVKVDGKTVKWSDFADGKKNRPRAFPMSRLPTLPAARYQQIENWSLDGTITHREKMRLLGTLDTKGFMDQYVASDTLTHKKIDEMVEDGKYSPPTPYGNLQGQLTIAQARIQQAEIKKVPPDRLRLIATFISALVEMIDDDRALHPPQMPAPGPGPGAPMMPPPQEQAPVSPQMEAAPVEPAA